MPTLKMTNSDSVCRNTLSNRLDDCVTRDELDELFRDLPDKKLKPEKEYHIYRDFQGYHYCGRCNQRLVAPKDPYCSKCGAKLESL